MDDIKQLEKELQKKTQKNIVNQITEIFNIWFQEFRTATNKILSISSKAKNIIPKRLDNFENKLIKLRQPPKT